MMAMRPPTSPTTVMGGFSLGINTEEKQKSHMEGEIVRLAVFQLLTATCNTFSSEGT